MLSRYKALCKSLAKVAKKRLKYGLKNHNCLLTVIVDCTSWLYFHVLTYLLINLNRARYTLSTTNQALTKVPRLRTKTIFILFAWASVATYQCK